MDFSFKEFNQIDNFGFSGADSGWFASLFNRLKDISKINPEIIFKNISLQNELRYHPINWDAKGMEIKRSDFTWVNKNIVTNEVEFPFYQFHISQALGRVIGYWEENVFNILLLDRMHNMQPSEFSDYKIRNCSPVETDISSLLKEIEGIKQLRCIDELCKVKKAVMNLSMVQQEGNAVIFFLDDDFLNELKRLSKNHSLTLILEAGIASIIV